jgi:hypothetical protein
MNLQQFKDKIIDMSRKLNQNGIYIPLLSDPKTKMGSVSLTLLFLSSVYVQFGLINKFAKIVDGVDMNNALEWFLITSGLYFTRSLSKKVQSSPNDTKPEDK